MKISRRANMKSLFTNVAWMLFISFSQPGHGANYDEAQVPNYALPELLETADGRMIKTAADWEQIRRPEILNLFRKQVFGKAPAAPESISFRIDRVYENSLNGLASPLRLFS